MSPATIPSSVSSPRAKIYFPEPRLDPRPRLPELLGGLPGGGRPHRQDDVVLREVGVEADRDPEGREVRIGHRVVHRRLGDPEELEGRSLHMERRLRKGLPEKRDHPFRKHPAGLGRDPRNDRDDPSRAPHGKPRRRPRGVRDDLRPFREIGLLGVVLRPGEAALLEECADMRQNGFIPPERKAEGPGDGRRRDVVGGGAEAAGGDHRLGARQQIVEGVVDGAVVVAHGEHRRHGPSLRPHGAGDQGGIGIRYPAACQLISDRQYADFHRSSSHCPGSTPTGRSIMSHITPNRIRTCRTAAA